MDLFYFISCNNTLKVSKIFSVGIDNYIENHQSNLCLELNLPKYILISSIGNACKGQKRNSCFILYVTAFKHVYQSKQTLTKQSTTFKTSILLPTIISSIAFNVFSLFSHGKFSLLIFKIF